ncbi:MAG: T9SS type A sorting domain-containing protein [Bacteroidales bacterium]|nr:T9SS type A sorting domain-containing protein [Bacteroidales bacterium]
MKKILLSLTLLFSVAVFSQTNVSVTVSKSSMTESESIDVIANIDAVTDKDVVVDFDFSGTAKNNIDYVNYFLSKGTGSTVAGGNGYGSDLNQLGQPSGIFVDLDGNMYIAEHDGDRVSKWAPGATEGVIVAGGNGDYGGALNQVDGPRGIFVDLDGNIYVSERGNHRVSKWAPGATEGVVVAGGNGGGSAANQLYLPFGVFVDLDGNVYVADAGNHRVQKWTPGATEGTTVAGGNDYGSAANQLDPAGLFVDLDGNIYVADYNNNRVQKWPPGASEGITVAGENVGGSAANQLDNPLDVFVDLEDNIYVADFYNHRIQKWIAGASEGITVAGGNGEGSDPNQITTAHGVFVDLGGNIYVADRDNQRIQKFQYAPQIVIPAGESTAKITVSGIVDGISDEGDETVIVDAVRATNASFTGSQHFELIITEDKETILAENFDGSVFLPTGWTQTITNTSNTWFQGNPTDNPFTAIDATNVYSALCPWVAEDQDEWLKSPAFALPDGILSLGFYAGYGTNWLSYATIKLYISINGGSDWSQIWEADNDGEAWGWRKIDIDLSTYANNSNVMLAWQYVGNDGDMVGIDNVKIKQETTGITELIVDNTNFMVSNYPNPFSSQTTISLQLVEQSDVELSVYNSLGQKVESLFKGNLTAGNHQFNFDANGLKAGVYYYRITSNGNSSTKAMLLTD